MAHLTIRLLGPVQIALSGEPVIHFESEKARALLAYLAAEPDRPHRREALAEMFWPDRPEGAARANLRHTLACLRRLIGDHIASPPFLLPTRHTLQFDEASDAWVDVAAFSALLPGRQTETVQQLEDAVRLFRGPFLEDVSLADSAAFEEWQVLRREHFLRLMLDALWRLAESYERRGEYERALAHARRELELEPWDEVAQQQVMRLLALSGRRTEALAQYETFRRVVADERNIDPTTETTRLNEQIQQGRLKAMAGGSFLVGEWEPLPRLPGFLEEDAPEGELPVLVARERELAFLKAHLDKALLGHGRVVMVSGGPGRGKTALLAEFGRQAMEEHPDLLAAWGNCTAYSDAGDPYLPFRDITAMLTGDVETAWLSGVFTAGQARRLWGSLPQVMQALVQHGSTLIHTLAPAPALLARAALWCATETAAPATAPWLQQLRTQVELRDARTPGPEQNHLFQQVTDLLRELARDHPLLLILDDLQWADAASLGLLFHLGRRLAGTRILIAGAYRPAEVALGRGGERHPLAKVLSEFKRLYGDIWLDLTGGDKTEQTRFVDALLETMPNRLGAEFRENLVGHTAGHPLFTVELLRAMQARGDLVQDSEGCWTEGVVLDWERLPARVEGVIEERVGRLTAELRRILAVASVEGETFTAQVVAQVQKTEDGQLLHLLAHELEARHRLVKELGERPSGAGRLVRYKFGHVLVQNYLYHHLSQGERQRLHGRVAATLEQLHAGRLDELAVQLAHHFQAAGDDDRALPYWMRAARNAARVYAHAEAIAHYSRALEIAGRADRRSGGEGGIPQAITVADAYHGRGQVYETRGEFESAQDDYEAALRAARSAGERQAEWRALLDLAKLWRARDYSRTRDCLEQALALAHRLDDPAALADSLNWLGNWHLNMEEIPASLAYHAQALEIFEQLGDRRAVAATLNLLGIASLIGGDMSAGATYYDRAVALFRGMDDRLHLAASLTGRALAAGTSSTLHAVALSALPIEPHRDFEEAQRLAQEIGAPADEAWALWAWGLLHMTEGRYGAALEAAQSSHDLAARIGHREWIVGSRCVLAQVYVQLLAPQRALQQLDLALPLAEQLCSRHWVHNGAATRAAAYGQLGDWGRARACLETVLSPEALLDTLQGRYCWVRRAQVALAQGDPALALDIIERLTASAPGLPPGGVITFLWKLRGEALAAMGHQDKGISLLHAAIENARATGERFLLWRIHASLGRLYHAMNRTVEAEAQFSTARELVQELADTVPNEALKDHFLHRACRMLRSSP
jgi:adenylate cyclase